MLASSSNSVVGRSVPAARWRAGAGRTEWALRRILATQLAPLQEDLGSVLHLTWPPRWRRVGRETLDLHELHECRHRVVGFLVRADLIEQACEIAPVRRWSAHRRGGALDSPPRECRPSHLGR